MSCATSEELEPPWSRFPWIPMGSIGWRMGIGESYQMEWSAYVGGALTDLDAALAYLRRHPPAPRTWLGWIAGWLSRMAGEPEDETEDEDQPALVVWRNRVIDEQLVDDDVAYPVFVRNAERDGGMQPPWTWRGDGTPSSRLRYASRELGWWSRWLATECPDREAYFDEQVEPPAEWSRVAVSGRLGIANPAWEVGGAEALVATLAATGTLPPPWIAGHAPPLTINYDLDAADDRDRWMWWAGEMFEDHASWIAYLARWAAPPPAWVEWLAGDECFLPVRE
jgi:hypothetical protein